MIAQACSETRPQRRARANVEGAPPRSVGEVAAAFAEEPQVALGLAGVYRLDPVQEVLELLGMSTFAVRPDQVDVGPSDLVQLVVGLPERVPSRAEVEQRLEAREDGHGATGER